jgi:hypothetical protein
MLWARLLAYVSGTVDQELLLRNEYLAAENRILKGQIKDRLLLSEGEKTTLAEIPHRLGRKALEDVAATAKPDTILGWYRKLLANKFDGSKSRRSASSIRSDGAQHLPPPRHFSSPESKANGLMEELYPLTLGRFGGHGLFHDGSPNAQRVDDLLCAVLHSLGDSPSDTGRIHAVPGSGVDGAAGAKHDYGGVGKPEGLPLSAARPRCEVLPIISRPDQDGKCESASIAGRKPESELVRGTLGEVGQRRMSVEADPVWRIVAAASVAAIPGTLQVRFILPHLAMWLKNRVYSV